MLEKIFEDSLWASRFMVLLAVFFGLLGAVILFVIASVDIYESAVYVLNTYINHAHPDNFHEDVVSAIIGAVDFYLIGVVMLLFSFGLYELFISDIDAAKDEFYVLAGSASFFYDLLTAGGIGGVLSLANVFPDVCVELYKKFISGNLEEAKNISDKLVALNKQVSGTYGVAGVKAAMDIVGFVGGEPRRPLKPLTDEQKKNLETIIKESDFSQ